MSKVYGWINTLFAPLNNVMGIVTLCSLTGGNLFSFWMINSVTLGWCILLGAVAGAVASRYFTEKLWRGMAKAKRKRRAVWLFILGLVAGIFELLMLDVLESGEPSGIVIFESIYEFALNHSRTAYFLLGLLSALTTGLILAAIIILSPRLDHGNTTGETGSQ